MVYGPLTCFAAHLVLEGRHPALIQRLQATVMELGDEFGWLSTVGLILASPKGSW